MPGPVVQLGATIICPHGGQVTAVPSNAKVLVGGAPALVLTDLCTVAGCVFVVGPKPQPCVTARWLSGASKVLVFGKPVLVQQPANGLAFSAEQAPQGPPTVLSCQIRVVAT
jgi:hypothetical protein